MATGFLHRLQRELLVSSEWFLGSGYLQEPYDIIGFKDHLSSIRNYLLFLVKKTFSTESDSFHRVCDGIESLGFVKHYENLPSLGVHGNASFYLASRQVLGCITRHAHWTEGSFAACIVDSYFTVTQEVQCTWKVNYAKTNNVRTRWVVLGTKKPWKATNSKLQPAYRCGNWCLGRKSVSYGLSRPGPGRPNLPSPPACLL